MSFNAMAVNMIGLFRERHPEPKPGTIEAGTISGHRASVTELEPQPGETRRFCVKLTDGRFSTDEQVWAIRGTKIGTVDPSQPSE